MEIKSPLCGLLGIVLLAAAYTGMAYFGLMLSVPPGYATLFWPASGLALAAVYLCGYRLLPGVYLGSFLSNFLNFYPFESWSYALEVAVNPSLIGIGAMLQAFVGAYLLRRFIGPQAQLVALGENVKLALIGGPITSLISCSFASCVLYFSGRVPLDGVPFTWATWYAGDMLGVLVFTPILILLFNTEVSYRRKVVTAIPLTILFGLVMLMFFAFKDADKENSFEEFSSYVTILEQELDQRFDSYISDVQAFSAHYLASDMVTKEEFANYTDRIFSSLQDAHAVGWLRKVTPENQEQLVLQYKPDFYQPRLFAGGALREVPRFDREALPLFFVYPSFIGEDNNGIDILSHPLRAEAIKKAIDSGRPQSTAPLELIDEEHSSGFLVLAPLYEGRDIPEGVEARREAFESMIALAYRYETVFDKAVQKWLAKGLQVNIHDMGQPGEPIYASDPDLLFEDVDDPAFLKVVSYDFLGRDLQFTFFVDPSYVLANITWSIWYALVLSLAFTFVLTIFLLVLTGQTALVEKIVDAKTKEVEERSNFLRLIMENIPDMIFVKNEKFEIVRANKEFLELYVPDERDHVLGTTTLERFSKEEQDSILANDKEAFEQGYCEGYEHITDYLGAARTVFVKKVRFSDPDGHAYILGIARDMTAFLTTQKKLQSILDTAADGLITIRHNGVIETFNKACEDIFGYKAEEVIGQNVSMLMPKEDARDHGSHLYNYEHGQKSVVIGKGREIFGLKKDGSTFPMYLAVAEVNVGGRFLFSGILRDVSKEKAMIEEIERSRTELERSNRELEQFAYVASHDLKAPLRHVTLGAGFLKEQYAGKLDESGEKFLDVMERSAQRMQQMIDSLLEYARVGRGDGENMEPVDLKETLKEVKSLLETKIEEHGAKITARGLPQVYANKAMMERLFLNMVQNAIKYCPDDVTPHVKINAKHTDQGWEIRIADNGIGIEAQYADRIFQVFQRLHKDVEYEGTGIGLSICQRIVEFHGGTIALDKDYKNGAQFIITLPECGVVMKENTCEQ